MPAERRGMALVTGASGGIGAAICRALSTEGYPIIAQYRDGEDRARALVQDIQAVGGHATMARADLSTTAGISHLIRRVTAVVTQHAVPRLEVLVNNAGKLLGPSLSEATFASFDEYMAVNLRAPLFLIQGLSGLMRNGASIVNISSASAHIASEGDMVYAMSKAGLESLTRNTAITLAPRGIRVNGVIPGFTKNGHPAFDDERALNYMSGMSALGGVAEPDDVAEAVRFLASARSSRMTGTFVDVSGGMTLRPRTRSEAGSVRSFVDSE